ncbi:hypothetical protein [uncultured Methylobacterium sp.]|uniref:hypothetical protein n=1 Tax=uncultured Methylobacterium sp. TaxID=157278 RepID=UPI0035CA73A8
MKRDIADLRTTFSVAGADSVPKAANAAAKGLDAVAAAAGRNAAAALAGATAGARAAAAATAQGAAIAAGARAAAAAQSGAARAALDWFDTCSRAAAQASRAAAETARAGASAANAAKDQSRTVADAAKEAAAASAASSSEIVAAQARVERASEVNVRNAVARLEAVKKATAEAIRRAEATESDRSYDRKNTIKDVIANLDEETTERRRNRAVFEVGKQAELKALPRDRDGKVEPYHQEDASRIEDEIRQRRLADRRADRSTTEEKRGAELDLRNVDREAAERLRIIREAKAEEVAIAQRGVTEVKKILAEELIAEKEQAKQLAKIRDQQAKDAARAIATEARERQRVAAEQARELRQSAVQSAREAVAARKSYEKLLARKALAPEVEAGLRDPGKLQAANAAAAEKVLEKAKVYTERAEAIAAKEGAGSKATKKEKDDRAGAQRSLTIAENEARRLADAWAQVQKKLKEAEAEGEKAARTIERAGEAARRATAGFAERKAGEAALEKGMAAPARAASDARRWAALYEAAAQRVVRAADHARNSIDLAAAAGANPADLARIKAFEATKVGAAAARAERFDTLARRSATVAAEVGRRVAKAAADAERAQEKSARDAATAQEKAARRSAEAWERSMRRLTTIQRNLPSLMGNGPGFYQRLVTRGTLPVVGGAIGRVAGGAGRLIGGVAGMAGSAVGGVFGTLGSVIGMAGKAAGSIIGIGASAALAVGRMAIHLGTGALSILGKLGGAALSAAKKVAGIAKTVVIRTVVAGGGLAVAGYAAAKKSLSDSVEATRDVNVGAQGMGASLYGFQALSGAAKRSGVDMRDFQAATTAAKDAIYNIDKDPALADAFVRIGVTAKNADGTMLDTGMVLQQLMGKLKLLPVGEQWNVLNTVFGGPENVARMMPLIRNMANSTEVLGKAQRRLREQGAIVTPYDNVRMTAYNAATNDLKDSFLGLKLTIARTVGNDIIAGFYRFSNLIARNRFNVAALARSAFDMANGLVEVAKTGAKVGDTINANVRGGSVAKFILDGAYHVRRFAVGVGRLGTEFYRAFAVIQAQRRTAEQLTVQARGWVVSLTAAAIRIGMLPAEFARAYAAIRQQQNQTTTVMVAAHKWVLNLTAAGMIAGRALMSTLPFFREVWSTIRGDDASVTEYPWLLKVRAGLETVGRFAKEAWSTIRGDTGAVQEFPFLLRIREGVLATFNWVRDFATEAWTAVTNGPQDKAARFPFLFKAADAVRSFVSDVRTTWTDLQNVWNGFDPETALGAKLAGMIDTVNKYKDLASKAWDDLTKVFDSTPDSQQKFNFPWIANVAADLEAFAEKARKAWDVFKGFYDFADRSIQRLTAGKLDLGTAALVTGLLTLFGVTRVVFGGLKGLGLAAGALRGVLGRTAAAAGAGAVGAAAAGGLAGALVRTGTAAEEAGRRASTSAGLWGKLGTSIGGVASKIASSPGLMALLGIGGGIVGDMIGKNADPEHGTGKGYALAGGGIQGAALGASLGSMLGARGAAIGGLVGGAYGIWSGGQDYHEKRKAALEAQLRAQGKHEVADKVFASDASDGSEPEGLSAEESADYSKADTALADAERQLKEVMQPVGVDIAAIRQATEAGAGRAPGGAANDNAGSADDLQQVRIDGRAQANAMQMEAKASASKWAREADRLERKQMRDPMSALMRGSDPMSSLYTPPVQQAPLAAPAAAPAPGRQSALGGESEFTIRMGDGTERPFRGAAFDVSALRSELSRGLTPPSWSVA